MKCRMIVLLLLLCSLLCMSAAAAGTEYLVDDAGILTDKEASQLNGHLKEISAELGMDVVVYTTQELYGYSPAAAAEIYYDNSGFAPDGIVLLLYISETGNRYQFSTKGEAADIFDDTAFDTLEEDCVEYLREKKFEKAFKAYADTCEDIISSHGKISVVSILVCILIGAGLSFLIPMSILKGQLKTVRRQPAASSYVRTGSMELRNQRDIFLYQRVTRVAKPRNNSSSGGGRASSGRGGRGGGC